MCTVTYVPTKKGFVFTSNRDENPNRSTIPPAYDTANLVSFFGPKDKVAGGTWIGVSDKQRLVCLLNGGFVYHNPKTKFPKSRGLVVKTFLTKKNTKQALTTIDLCGVAPFTLLILDWTKELEIHQMVWCKDQKTITKLNAKQPYIWSSSTLYSNEIKNQRKDWFLKGVSLNAGLMKESILGFHQNENLGTSQTTPKMKREFVETISTTMVVMEDKNTSMDYHDYVSGDMFEQCCLFKNVKI